MTIDPILIRLVVVVPLAVIGLPALVRNWRLALRSDLMASRDPYQRRIAVLRRVRVVAITGSMLLGLPVILLGFLGAPRWVGYALFCAMGLGAIVFLVASWLQGWTEGTAAFTHRR